MSLEQLFRQFWWVFLLALIFVWQNIRRKAKIRAVRRRSLAKARRAKASGVRSTRKPSRRKKGDPKPKTGGKRKKISKKEFLNRMRLGKLRAARARRS